MVKSRCGPRGSRGRLVGCYCEIKSSIMKEIKVVKAIKGLLYHACMACCPKLTVWKHFERLTESNNRFEYFGIIFSPKQLSLKKRN